jgi:hypothetical protein
MQPMEIEAWNVHLLRSHRLIQARQPAADSRDQIGSKARAVTTSPESG